MPELRKGQGAYATASGVAVLEGAPVAELTNLVGVAIKQVINGPDIGYGATANKQVQIGEAFFIQTKGQVLVTNARVEGGTFVKGDKVYIVPATATKNQLSTTNTNVKYGIVIAIAGERGVPTGLMRVDLDLKALC